MAKFTMECPRCKKPLQVSTGLFAKNKITCPQCKREINVALEKMVEEACPKCGGRVVYDASKPSSAICPACHTDIKKSGKPEEITCPACQKHLSVDKNAKTCICPQCKITVDVQSRLAQRENSEAIQVIKWDGENGVFIYRHPVENFKLGSQLIVKESQKAVFFRNGQALDVFGPGRYTLETQNLPLIEQALKYPADADVTFSSQVYFVKTDGVMPVKWSLPYTPLRNPGMDFYVQVGACGSADIKVIEGNENVRKFIAQVIGTVNAESINAPVSLEKYDSSYLENKFRDYIIARLGSFLADIITSSNINILDLAPKRAQISDMLIKEYNEMLEEYGLMIPMKHFMVTDIKLQQSAELDAWMRQESERVLKVREEGVLKAEAEARQGRVLFEEQTEAQRKVVLAQGESEARKISAQADADASVLKSRADAEGIKLTGQASAEAYTAQAVAEAEEMHVKGYTYAQETSRQLGLEALQNGLPGTGSGSGASSGVGSSLGDMVGLGVGLSALGGVVNMTKDIVNPVMSQISEVGKPSTETVAPQTNLVGAWNCACGKSCITSKFCPDCGTQKPEVGSTWNCTGCGQKDIATNFCPNCGNKRG